MSRRSVEVSAGTDHSLATCQVAANLDDGLATADKALVDGSVFAIPADASGATGEDNRLASDVTRGTAAGDAE